MSLLVHYALADGTSAYLPERVQIIDFAVTVYAEEGSVAQSEVTFDDPDGDLDINGISHITFYDDTAPVGQQVLVSGHAYTRNIERGPYRTGAGRIWRVMVADHNEHLSRRLFWQDEADRPEETDAARMAWLITTPQMAYFDDYTYVSSDEPVLMDAVNYQGQKAIDVIDDCAQQSGKNYFVIHGTDETDVRSYGLFYDFSRSEVYDSGTYEPVRISNYLADMDEPDTYLAILDGSLERSPDRVYSHVYIPYDGGAVFVGKQSTATEFVIRHGVMPSINLKTAEAAEARARRYLDDIDTETDVISTGYECPSANVNDLRAGQRCQVRFTHLPGYEDWTWCRVLRWTARMLHDDRYRIEVELAPQEPTPEASPVYGVLQASHGPFGADSQVYFAANGDNPGRGWGQPKPITVGLLDYLPTPEPAPPNSGGGAGFEVLGTGTVDVRFHATFSGVLVDNTVFTVTWQIALNGAAVVSGSEIFSGFLEYVRYDKTIEIEDLAVVPGDEITAHLACVPPTMPYFHTPAGVGDGNEVLEIYGGSLA